MLFAPTIPKNFLNSGGTTLKNPLTNLACFTGEVTVKSSKILYYLLTIWNAGAGELLGGELRANTKLF